MSAPAEAYLAALAALPDVGPSRLRWLLQQGEPAAVWALLRDGRLRSGATGATGVAGAAGAAGSAEPDGPSPPAAELLAAWGTRAGAPWPERLQRQLTRLGVEVLHGPSLPERLRHDRVPPVVLFHQGRPVAADTPMVAVVGTRRATGYGLRVAEALGRELSLAGVCVVSGLALGIDAAAHRGAVQGPTPPVAVVGAGLDRPCPVRNRELAVEVARRGCLLSEVPPGVPSAPWRFPARNRCLAALADVVVVVESRAAGGSMLTVAEALDRDRAVMAVPGPVDRSTSEGCHLLLRDGAQVCTGAPDVLSLLGLVGAPPSSQAGAAVLGPVAAGVLEVVADRAAPADAVMAAVGADLGGFSSALAELEAAGLIARHDGWIERTSLPLRR